MSVQYDFEVPERIAVRNPRTGVADFEFYSPTRSELRSRVDRLRAAQSHWATIGIDQRVSALRSLQRELMAHHDELVAALSEDTGREVLSVAELAATLAMIDRWCALVSTLSVADEARYLTSDSVVVFSHYVAHSLVGVISSSRLPLSSALIDAIPALLAGCAVVIKPSEIAPRFGFPLSDSIARVGALADVLRVIPGGSSTGEDVVAHVDAVCFNGSAQVGRKVAEHAARRAIPVFLGAGGPGAAIITATADLDIAARVSVRASCLATGHARQAIERIYVDHRAAAAFVEKLVTYATQFHCGDVESTRGLIGPLMQQRHADIAARQIADAVTRGARILCGGAIEHAGGLWLAPTVIVDVDRHMSIAREPVFGPIMPVMSFKSIEEAVDLANESPNSQSTALLTSTLDEAHQIARRLHASSISLNEATIGSPILGSDSYSIVAPGMGRSSTGRAEYLRFFRRRVLVCQPHVVDSLTPTH